MQARQTIVVTTYRISRVKVDSLTVQFQYENLVWRKGKISQGRKGEILKVIHFACGLAFLA